jgi:hypothetical protein
MMIDPMPAMHKYLNGKPLSANETELLLFALYMDNVRAQGAFTMSALKGRNVLTRCICGAQLELER